MLTTIKFTNFSNNVLHDLVGPLWCDFKAKGRSIDIWGAYGPALGTPGDTVMEFEHNLGSSEMLLEVWEKCTRLAPGAKVTQRPQWSQSADQEITVDNKPEAAHV